MLNPLLLGMLLLVCIALPVVYYLETGGKLQFSLKAVMLATAYLALIFASLKSNDWSMLFLPITFVSLGTAVLGIHYRTGERRAFWVGFCVFGLGYLAMLWLMGSFGHNRPDRIFLIFHLPVSLAGAQLARYFYRSQDSA